MSVTRIRALVVDDEPRLIESIRTRLGREIGRKLGSEPGWEADWETATDVDRGLELLESTTVPFDLVVADLLFPREDFPDELEDRGLDIIRTAAQHCPRAFILAITTGDDRLHDLLDDARKEGAHHVVRRNDFSTTSQVHSPAAIARQIREHLLDNGTVLTGEVTADPGDLGVQALLQQVGKPTISRLYAKMLEADGRRTDRIELRFLTPGASGASVCGVTALVDGIPVSHIMKLSKAEDVLAGEAARGRQARDAFSPSLLVQHQPPHPVGAVNGWYALGSPLVERATTLRQWLGSRENPPTPDAVADLMEALFVDRLAPVYARGGSRSVPLRDRFSFTAYRQQLILRILDELREALERGDGGALGRETDRLAGDLTAFVTQRRLPGAGRQPPIPPDTYVCYSHGDLHAGNVMVPTGRHPPPQLIDTSHTGIAHWATDPAWLAADLLMRSVDAGTESMLFTGFGVWRDLARKFGAGRADLTAVTTTPATTAALAALSWIATNLHRVSPVMQPSLAESSYRWEWHLSLARNLLRCTYHSDIPHAKRALAFAAAYDQLTAAAQALPE
jgi:CheY-like chemotaxis protein